MKFIKNHSIEGVQSPFSEMEILPLIETHKEAEEYATTIGYKVGYYSEDLTFQYRVPNYLVVDKVGFLCVGKYDTYDVIELNKNEDIEIKNGICSIKKKRVLYFETILSLFAIIYFGIIFIWDLYADPDYWTFAWLMSFLISFYLGFSNYRKNKSCKK